MSINLNSTLPAAPAGSTNGVWATDGSGNVSVSLPIASNLAASRIDLTGQTANIGATNLVASPTAGVYRISVYIVVTTAGGSSSVLPSVTITWNDQQSAQLESLVITATSAGNALTTYMQATAVISANTSAIQYATNSYASAGVPQMQYALHIRVESL